MKPRMTRMTRIYLVAGVMLAMLTGCSWTPAQRRKIEARGAERALEAVHAFLDATEGGSEGAKEIYRVRARALKSAGRRTEGPSDARDLARAVELPCALARTEGAARVCFGVLRGGGITIGAARGGGASLPSPRASQDGLETHPTLRAPWFESADGRVR